MTYISNKDPFVLHAIQVIKSTYGDDVSLEAKNKDLIKFGRNESCQTSKTTIMTLPSGITNETYISTNGITTISSSSVSDTSTILIEGHTISGSNLTFVVQTVTLNGQNQVTLSTPLARIGFLKNTSAVDLVGNIYCYETDTTTAGVPNTSSKIHIMINAGLNNSEKAATSISSTDYYLLTGFYCDCLETTSTYGIVHLESRVVGTVFTNLIDISVNDNTPNKHEFRPYFIIPKNSDIRLRVTSSSANKDFSGGFEGMLLKII